MSGLRDTLTVAWFQFLRALRTRSGLGMVVIYMLSASFSAWAARAILHELEKAASRELHAPVTQTPGTMIETLKASEEFRSMIGQMIPGDALTDWALQLPFLSLTHFWTCLGMLPFLAVAAGVEALGPDTWDRSIRYELSRVRRMDLVLGRFLARGFILMVAGWFAVLGPWILGSTMMANVDPWEQAWTLLDFATRLGFWSLPFLALGLTASQIFLHLNLTRAAAIIAVSLTWIGWTLTLNEELVQSSALVQGLVLLGPVLPQNWVGEMFGPGTSWLSAGGGLVFLGFLYLLPGYAIFVRRDL